MSLAKYSFTIAKFMIFIKFESRKKTFKNRKNLFSINLLEKNPEADVRMCSVKRSS